MQARMSRQLHAHGAPSDPCSVTARAGGLSNGALTIATTHHSVMTSLKFEDARFENASVEFDEAALAPTYKLLWGVPGAPPPAARRPLACGAFLPLACVLLAGRMRLAARPVCVCCLPPVLTSNHTHLPPCLAIR